MRSSGYAEKGPVSFCDTCVVGTGAPGGTAGGMNLLRLEQSRMKDGIRESAVSRTHAFKAVEICTLPAISKIKKR